MTYSLRVVPDPAVYPSCERCGASAPDAEVIGVICYLCYLDMLRPRAGRAS